MNKTQPPALSSTATAALDPRDEAIAGLARLQTLRRTVVEMRAKFETDIAAIEEAIAKATSADSNEIERLEASLKNLAVDHAEEVFGTARTLVQGALALCLKESEAVEFIGDEDDVIATLKRTAQEHPNEAVRFAAKACLRVKYEVNKRFVLDHWEGHAEWFESFGLVVVQRTSASIAERKSPPTKKEKVTRKKGKKPAEPAAPPAPAAEASTEGGEP